MKYLIIASCLIAVGLLILFLSTDNRYTRERKSLELIRVFHNYMLLGNHDDRVTIIQSMKSKWDYEGMYACSLFRTYKLHEQEFRDELLNLMDSPSYIVRWEAIKSLPYTTTDSVQFNKKLLDCISTCDSTLAFTAMDSFVMINRDNEVAIKELRNVIDIINKPEYSDYLNLLLR